MTCQARIQLYGEVFKCNYDDPTDPDLRRQHNVAYRAGVDVVHQTTIGCIIVDEDARRNGYVTLAWRASGDEVTVTRTT